jgi:hypothetical protein
MGIGTSLGNYYPDEHAYQAREFTPQPVSDTRTYSMNPMLDAQEGTRPMAGGGRLAPAPVAPERVGPAALIIKGKTYTGTNHGEAFGKFMDEQPNNDPGKDWKDGFVTTTGRFVSREEAFEIAKKQDQVDPQVLKSLPADQEGSMLLSEDLIQ